MQSFISQLYIRSLLLQFYREIKKKSLEVISTLEQLGLEERIIFVEDDVKEKSYLYKKPIKYGVVDYKLKAFIEHSKEWLGKCLE